MIPASKLFYRQLRIFLQSKRWRVLVIWQVIGGRTHQQKRMEGLKKPNIFVSGKILLLMGKGWWDVQGFHTRMLASVQLSSGAQLCLTLCDSMDFSSPGFPVHHQLPEFTQTHVHWVGDAIQTSSSVIPFSYCLQSFQASGSFQMSQFFASGGQSIGVSASATVLPMNIQDWLPLGWTGWISLQSKGLTRVFSNTTIEKHQFFKCSAFFIVKPSHLYMTNGKTIALTRWTFVAKVMSLLFIGCLGWS